MRKILSIILCVAVIMSCTTAASFGEEITYPEYSAEIMKVKGGANAIVSMTFDDGIYDTAVYLNEAFERYGLKGSCMMIANKITESNLSKWQELFALGNLEPQSHTMTHLPIPADNWAATNGEEYLENNTDENYQIEIVDSKKMLEEYFPNNDILTFAPSNNTLSDGAYEVVCDTYYAVRSGAGGINSVQSLDPTFGTEAGSWHNLKMTGFSQNKSPTRLYALCDRVDRCVEEGAWFVSLTHGISDTGDFTVEEAEKLFAYMAQYQNEGKLWCATFSEAVKYLRERQNSTVTEYENENGLFVELTMAPATEDGLSLDADVFDYPLTVKAELPEGWRAVSYAQGENCDTAVAFEEDGSTYAYIDIVPNGGAAKLSEMDMQTTELSSNGSYGVSGKSENIGFDGEGSLLVSGRVNTYTVNENKKAYASLSLEDYESGVPAILGISVTSNVSGDIYVYGVKEGLGQWSADSINYLNAPANDIFTSGADENDVFSNSAIGKVSVSGPGLYTLDISNFAEHMCGEGEESVTLMFTADISGAEAQSIEFALEENIKYYKTITFDNLSSWRVAAYKTEVNDTHDMALGGGVIADLKAQLVTAEDHTTGSGKSLWLCMPQNYNRFRFYNIYDHNLTTADLGRTFNITFWAKSDIDGYFKMGMSSTGSGSSYTSKFYTDDYNKTVQGDVGAGVWKQFSYDITVTEPLLDSYYTDNLGKAFNPALFTVVSTGLAGGNLYVDDIVIKETTQEESAGYSYSADIENLTSLSHTSNTGPVVEGKVATWTGIDADSATGVSTTENHTKGGSKSIFMKASQTYHKFHVYNIIDSLTDDDIGRKFNVSFYLKANKTGSFKADMTAYSKTASTVYNVSSTGTWTKYTKEITIDEDMVTNGKACLTIQMSGFSQSASDPVYVYIDDISSKEVIASGKYSYKDTVENHSSISHTSNTAPLADGKIMTWAGLDDGASVSISTGENHTKGGSKSVQLHSTKTYNRLYFYNMSGDFTEEDIGKTYKASFYMKASRAGSFKIAMTSKAEPKEDVYTLSKANAWTRFSYDITIDADMISNNQGFLTLMMSGFSQTADNPVDIYLDDFSSVEVLAGEQQVLPMVECATVSNASTEKDTLKVSKLADADMVADGIHKTYFKFENQGTDNVGSALLTVNVEKTEGQRIDVYAVEEGEWPASVTYKNAPAYTSAEGADTNAVYRGTAIAKIIASAAGEYAVDVTDYVVNRGDKDYIFILCTDENGGNEYINLDFETIKLTNGIDYVADENITITDGAAVVSGNRILIANAFAGTVKAGETYMISADVTTDGNASIGAATADGTVSDSTSYSVSGTQKLEFSYTADEEDESAGVCSVVIECANAGFGIDNFTVENEKLVVLDKKAALAINTIEEPDNGMVKVSISVVDGTNVNINGEDKGRTITADYIAGSVLAMTAESTGEFLYWIDTKSNTILSYNESFIYTVGTDRSIAAVYADSAYVFVTFTSMANKLEASGISGSVEVPEDPYVYGYKFNGWYADGKKAELEAGAVVTAETNTEYIAGFVKDTAFYEVTVDGNVTEYSYNEKVTYTAEAEKDGKAFSYWKRDGEIVSYNTEYSFYVNGDTTVESVYGETVSAKAVLAMANPVLVGTDKIAFFAERDIPTECTLIETGILVGTTAGVTLDNAYVKATAKSTLNKGQYTIRKANVKSGDTYFGVAYAIYRDGSGSVVTDYSNEVSYTVK